METYDFQQLSYNLNMDSWLLDALAHSGISQAELARRLTAKLGRSIDRAAVNKMTKGSREISADELIAISEICGYALPVGNNQQRGEHRPPPPLFAQGPKLPVYAAAEGGNGHLIVDFTPIDYLPRPQMFEDVSDAYAVLITGESMVPAFEPGDHALVHPRLPPIRGVDVIVYELDDAGGAKATIKRLIGISDTEWTLQQWNPPKTLKLKRADWPKCHRVVGKFSRR